jgi:glycosyltransferase involved in cell wall biosynthesis
LFHFNRSSYDITKLEFFTDEEKKYIRSFIVDFPESLPFPGHYLYRSYKHSRLIYAALEEQLSQYDLIYTKGFSGWYLINQKFKKRISCAPVAVKFHGYEMFQKPPDFKIWLQYILLLRMPVKNLSQRADLVFSYGGKITDIIKSIGVAPHKIIELPSGVEESTLVPEIHFTSDTVKFLFLGRYERRKGIEELNAAILLFFASAEDKKAEFHFIGPVPEDKRLRYAQVFYHGEVRDKAELQKKIKASDILVCPSWSEGMPNVILEAMANGLAVIATDVGANNVLVNSQTGWLLDRPNPPDIRAVFDEILQLERKVIDNKKEKARQLISEEFVWEKLIGRFCSFFK